MSFIGADGQDHKIRALTAQVQSKDGELASVRNELAKCKEGLAEEKKARQALEHQIEFEAQGRESSGKDVTGMKNEIASLRQNLYNRETLLAAANDTIKQLEREKQGLEYELETAGSSSSDATQRLARQKNKLEAEVKSLKQEIHRRDSEDARSKAANAKTAVESGIPPPSNFRMKRSNTQSNLFPSPSPSPCPSPGPSRRRSTSLSNARELELEKEAETLRTQISSLKIRVDKAENLRLAAEQQAKKQREELEIKMDEQMDELLFYRSNGGSDPKEIEKLMKSNQALKETVQGLMTDLDVAQKQSQRGKAADVENAGALVDELKATITSLEAQLAEQPVPTVAPSADLAKDVRQLRRDLKSAERKLAVAEQEREDYEREREQLEQERDAYERDNALLKARGGGVSVDWEEFERRGVALAQGEELIEQYQRRLEAQMEAVEATQPAMAALKSQVEDLTTALDGVRKELLVASTAVDAKSREVDGLTEEMSTLRSSATAHESAIADVRAELATAREDWSQAQLNLQDAQKRSKSLAVELKDAQDRAGELESQLASVQSSSERIEALEQQIATLTASKTELEALEFGAKAERDQAREERDGLVSQIEALQGTLREVEQAKIDSNNKLSSSHASMQALRTELEDTRAQLDRQTVEVERLSDDLQKSASDNAALELKHAEMCDAMANRSTETEAQHRQEELFQLQEDLEIARREKLGLAELAKGKSDEIALLTTKVQDLEQRVAEKVAVPTESLLHDKIKRLRVERDELRQTMSFAQHEHRFSLQASEEAQSSLLDELKLAQANLLQKQADAEKSRSDLVDVQSRYDAASAQIDNLQARLSTDDTAQLRADLSEAQTKRYELQEACESLESARTCLVNDIEMARHSYTTTMSKLQQTLKQLSVVEMERDELRDARDGDQEPARPHSSMATPGADAESRVRRHSRRQSMQDLKSSMTADVLAQNRSLEKQLRDEKDRVGRRDAAIKMHQQLVQKLNANIASAGQDAEIASEEYRAALQTKDDEVVAVQKRVDEAVANVSAAKAELAASTAAVSQASIDLDEALSAKDALSGEIASLRTQLESTATRIGELEIELVNAQERTATVSAERDAAQSSLSSDQESTRVEMEEMFIKTHSLEKQVQRFKESEAGLQAQLEAMIADAADVDEAHKVELEKMEEVTRAVKQGEERIVEMTSKMTATEAELAIVQSKRDELDTQLQAKIVALDEANEAVVAMQTRTVELDQQVASLTATIETKSQELAAVVLASEATKRQLTAVETERDALTVKLAESGERVAQLETAVTGLSTKSDTLQARVDAFELEIASLSSKAEQATTEAITVSAQRESLQQRVDALEQEIASVSGSAEQTVRLSKERDELKEQVEGMAARISVLQTAENTMRQEMDAQVDAVQSSAAERLAVKAELDQARVELADAQSRADTLSAQAADQLAESRLALSEVIAREASAMADLTDITNKHKHLESELSQSRAAVQEIETTIMNKEAVISKLRTTNSDLEAKLADLQAKVVPGTADAEAVLVLKETIENLEAMLSQRTAECEAYDDKLSDATKNVKTLERKMQKMARDAKKREKDDELARNTALNVKLAQPTPADIVPPIETSSAPARTAPLASRAPTSAPSPATQTTRQPLRKVNVFDRSQIPTSFSSAMAGVKRPREDGEVKVKPADAIMLAPSAPVDVAAKARVSGLGTGHGHSMQTPGRNPFAAGDKENAARPGNAPGGGGGGGLAAGVRMTPRNVFSPEP